jgi:hypothetical protein
MEKSVFKSKETYNDPSLSFEERIRLKQRSGYDQNIT